MHFEISLLKVVASLDDAGGCAFDKLIVVQMSPFVRFRAFKAVWARLPAIRPVREVIDGLQKVKSDKM